MSVQTVQLEKGGIILRVFRIFVVVVIVLFTGGSLVSKIMTKGKLVSGRNKIKGGYELADLTVNGKPLHPAVGDIRYYKSIYLEPQARWNTILDFSKEYHPRMLMIQWHSKSDSVITFIKKQNDVTDGRIDSATMFKGTYTLLHNKLYVNGIQYGDTIKAVYYKKDLKIITGSGSRHCS